MAADNPIPFQSLKRTNAPLMEEYVAAAERVLRSGLYINGPEVSRLEEELAAATGTKFCVAVSTGLDALRLIFKAYVVLGRLKEGDEAIIPANTFIATFLAAIDAGLKIVPAEIEETTFCLDFSKLPLTPRTRVIVPVHLFGNPCWDETVIPVLRQRGILIIEDNAQALGASFRGTMTGSLGDAAAVSFYPAKNIGAFGDAGAVLTNDDLLAQTVRELANYGSAVKYCHKLPGFNCRMDELQAALLRVKLPTLEKVNKRRRDTALLYDSQITNQEVRKPRILKGERRQAWHQYVIRHPQRDKLRDYLATQGIGTEIHYPVPCHRQQALKGVLGENLPSLPMAERLASEILSLPIADVSEEEVGRIAALINRFN